jgi:hypothetical protein
MIVCSFEHVQRRWALNESVARGYTTGTPKGAEAAAIKACSLLHHYPPADFEPALTDLCRWIWPGGINRDSTRLA